MKARSLVEFVSRYAYVWSRSTALLVAGVASSAGRHRIQRLSWSLGYGEGAPRLPKVPLTQLVGSGISITLCEPSQDTWEATTFEVSAINSLVTRFKPGKAFEIGTFDGRTTVNIAANLPSDGVMFTLDLPPGTYGLPNGVVAGGKFRNHALRDRITQLYGDSKTFDFSPYYGQIDFAFVDAGHSYEDAANDTAKALAMVEGRPGGIIVWHDYAQWSGVSQAVDELIPRMKKAKLFAQIEGTSLACLMFE